MLCRESLQTGRRVVASKGLRLAPFRAARCCATARASRGRLSQSAVELAGSTTGAALFAISGSVLAWPLADLWLGPQVALLGIRPGAVAADSKAPAPQGAEARKQARLAAKILKTGSKGQPASAYIVAGGRGFGKALEREAAAAKRPVVYLPLNEATCPHHLFVSVQNGVYSSDRLGYLGTLCNSMAVWWVVLFDVLVGREFYMSRAFHLSIVLSHLRRALHMAASGPQRPLIVLDHVDDVTSVLKSSGSSDADVKAMRSMLLHLSGWCNAVCFDDGIVDVVVCGGPEPASDGWWPLGGSPGVSHIEGAREFRTKLREVLL